MYKLLQVGFSALLFFTSPVTTGSPTGAEVDHADPNRNPTGDKDVQEGLDTHEKEYVDRQEPKPDVPIDEVDRGGLDDANRPAPPP